jgi:type I restriction enzyme, S subunit
LKSKLILNNPWVSQIPKGWNYSTLQDVCSEIIDNRGKTVPTSESGIPLIATNCIKNDKLFPTYERVRYVSKEIYENWFRGHPKPGDIIFVNKGSPGRICFVPDPIDFCIAQDMVALRANEDLIYPKFLFAAIRSRFFQTQVDAYFVGTMIPHLKKSSFNELVIPIPSPKIQKIIGDIYYQLSLQISNLEKMNFILEKIIQAIFKSWFVDFDEQTEFVDSELGQIPKGWNVKKFSDITNILSGGTPSTKNPDYWNGDIGWIAIDDLNQGIFVLDTEKKITPLGLEKSSAKMLPKDSIVISARGTVGAFSIISKSMTINQSCYALTGKENINEVFLFFLLKFSLSDFIQNVNGTVFDTITRSTFDEINIICPNDEKIFEFQNSMKHTLQKIQNNQIQIQSFKEIRDSLLPKLMSGEIKI